MENFNVVGLDLAKSIFQVHVANAQGKKLLTKRLKRCEVLAWFAAQPPSLVGMEACGGAHEWARQLQELGHRIKLMAPQHVKPYVQGSKTDARDAAAICEAASRECVPAVAVRSRDSQQMQVMHRVRESWMKQRTAIANQLRGHLAEFGQALPAGIHRIRAECRNWQMKEGQKFGILNQMIDALLEQFSELDNRLKKLEQQLLQIHRNDTACQLIESIPGIGMLTATGVISHFGHCNMFGSARKFACALGLTPREHSSGGKQVLLGISKRGNGYLRKLLVHGARAVVSSRMNKPQYEQDWVVKLVQRRGMNIAVCALAAKNARRIWAMLQSGEKFRADYAGKAPA